MRLMPAALAIAALLAPLPASAEDWFRLKPVSGIGYNFVDLDSVHKQGEFIVAQSISVHMPVIPGTQFRWMWIEAEYDCDAGAAHFLKVKGFGEDRGLISEFSEPMGSTFVPARSGSDGETITNFVCNADREGAVRVSDPWTVLPPAEDQ